MLPLGDADHCSHVGIRDSIRFLSSASNMWPYIEAGLCSIKDLLIQFLTLLLTILRVFLFVVVLLVKMGTGIMPAFLSLVSSVYEFHRTQLTATDLVFEFIFVSLMLVMLVYSKEILDYIWHVEMKLERSSKEATRKAMRIAPHVTFFATSFIFSVLGRRIFHPLSHERVLPLFSLVLPVLRTVYGSLLMPTNTQQQSGGTRLMGSVSPHTASATIGTKKKDENVLREMHVEDLERIAASGRRTILLWIVLAMYHSVATVLTHTPFVGRLRHFFPFLRELVLVVLLWAQLNPLFIEIVYEAASPVLVKAASFIPSSSAEEERGLAILSFLKSVNVINEATETFFRALCVESTSFVLILIFIFVPSPSHVLAHVGTVTISLLLPAIRAAAVITQWEVMDHSQGAGRGVGREIMGQDSRVNSAPSMAERGKDMLAQIGRTLSLGEVNTTTTSGSNNNNNNNTDGSTFNPSSTPPQPRDRGCTFNVGVFTTGRKIRKASVTTSSLILRQKRWLEYFTCIAIVWLLRCHGIQIWPSVGMLLAWYLSHSLWAGARPWSRYLVKVARLGMVLLTPIILYRMIMQLVGFAVTITTPKKDPGAVRGGYTSPRATTTTGNSIAGGGSGGRAREVEALSDPRMMRFKGEAQRHTPLATTATVAAAAGNDDNDDGGDGEPGSVNMEKQMSPFDMNEVGDDHGDSDVGGNSYDGDIPTPGSVSLSTPGLREHRITAMTDPGSNSMSSSSSQRGGRSEERDLAQGQGGRPARRVSSKTRR